MFRGKILWLLMAFILIILILGAGITVYTFRRATALGNLRIQADKTLQSIYLLTNTAYTVLYNSEDIEEGIEVWQDSFAESFLLLDKLAYHDALRFLDPEITSKISQTKRLWSINTNGFISGEKNLRLFLESGFPIEQRTNIKAMLDDAMVKDQQEDLDRKAAAGLFPLRQAFIEIDSTNDQLWYFTTSALEHLGSDIQSATDRAMNITLVIAGSIVLLLIILIIAALLSGLRLLRNSNIMLEAQVSERTGSIRNLLDFSGEGFLSFGPDFVINPEFSRECTRIFGRDVAGENLAELLYGTEESRNDFRDALSLIFTGTSQPDVVFDFIDSRVVIDKKTIRLNFHLVDQATIMCQLTDITETEKLESLIEIENAHREMVLRAVTSKKYFTALLDEADLITAALEGCIEEGNYCAGEDDNENIIRQLHTFKANAAFLKMKNTVDLAHQLESSLIDYGVLMDSEPLGPEISEFRSGFKSEVESIVNIIGRDWIEKADSEESGYNELKKLRAYILENYPQDTDLIELIEEFSFLPLSDIFTRLSDLALHLADSNGKRIILETDIDDITISHDLYNRISDAVNHIIRNMITHGIEFPRHREKAGKPAEGKITIKAVQQEGHIEIALSDDGGGISLNKIRSKAEELGHISPADDPDRHELIKMIFSPGFSTADTVTAVSGRGYGLSAVKENIYEIGGKISVKTSRGRGTGFTIRIPRKRKAS